MNAAPAIVPDGGRGQSLGAENEDPAAYLDSGILVAQSLGAADMHHDGAVGICDEVVRDGYRLVTSPLAVMETIGVVRRRTAMSHKCRPGRGEDLLAADADVRGAVAHALAIINNMEIQGRLAVVGAAGWSPDFVLMQRKMLEHAGRTVSGRRSRTCRHRGVGLYDWFHYALAREAGATVICTTDAALADIVGNDGKFGHIRVLLAARASPGRAA